MSLHYCRLQVGVGCDVSALLFQMQYRWFLSLK